jgi:NADH dehydrogenase
MTQALTTPGLVTVFGGSGFLGRYAVRALAKDGWRIRVAMRRPHLAPELRVMGDVGQIELLQANVRYPDSIADALTEADAVVNLVGVLYQSGRQSFEALQARAARDIAAAAARQGIGRMIQVSAIGADANSPSTYARTKAEGEMAVRSAIHGAVVLRPSVVFGEEDQFFNRFAAMAGMSPALPLIGGGKTLMQPIYAGDVGAAITVALSWPEAAGRTFELGGPAVYSFKTLMEIMLKQIGRRRLLVPVPFPAAHGLGMLGDAAAFLGLPPPLTTDQVTLLRVDNVVAAGAATLADLQITPTALEAVLPSYLWKYRSGGQFAQPYTSPSR